MKDQGLIVECYGFVGGEADFDRSFRELTNSIVKEARRLGFRATVTLRVDGLPTHDVRQLILAE